MGRDIKPRGGQYDNDATVVLRIKRAVEADPTVTEGWRNEAAEKLGEAVQLLLAPNRVPTSMGRAKGGRG